MDRVIAETSYWLKSFLYLPYFWYVEGIRMWVRMFYRTIIYIDQITATSLMLRFIFVPLFGDYTIIGRVLAIPFRLSRIVFGLLALICGIAGVLAAAVIWFAGPIWFLAYRLDLALVSIALLWVFGFYIRLGRPHLPMEEAWQEGFQILDFAEDSARVAIRRNLDAPNLLSFAAKTRSGRQFLFLLGPHQLTAEKVQRIDLSEVYRAAYDLAFSLKCPAVRIEHLLTALFQLAKEQPAEALENLKWVRKRRDWSRAPFIWDEEYRVGAMGGVNRAWTGRVTPALDMVSTDLTAEAAKGHLKILIGKAKPLVEVAQVLGRAAKANALIVGPPGSGKTSFVEGLSYEIVRGAEYEALRGKRLVQLDIGALVAGAKSQGELGERLQTIIEEINLSRGIILFIDEIHSLVLSSSEIETSFVLNSLRPHLETGKLQLLGATSWENYRKYLVPNEAFSRVFELVEIPSASRDESVEVLEYQVSELERINRGVRVTLPAIFAAVELSDKLIYERVLPDKAMDLLEEAVLAKKIQGGGAVGREEVATLVSQKTKVPVTAITQKEAGELLHLEERIHEGLINQEEAVKGVADALRRARAGLREEEKPIATFLFVGPTGVGKTELSKVLAKINFGGKEALVRVDMTEFADLKNIYRLIGSPPGSDVAEPGQLIEAVRQRPFSLILLDEFEKAHPQIRNLFLQVFDDGRLTGGNGDTVDFTNTIIIATSNAGTKFIQDQLSQGRGVEEFKGEFMETLRQVFPPELLNRFDGVMVFKPLTHDNLTKIVALQIKGLEKDLAAKSLKMVATPEFIDRIAQLGYAPEWGARPLTRVMQDQVEAPLAKKILSGEIKEGDTVTLDLNFLS
ncbi:MAG: ATP-dependent Clp protease ATP-binding subunit [Patescibacteria group bacterium]